MKLFSHNAGQLLFDKARTLQGQHDSWRCLYINFSDSKKQYSDGLRTNIVTSIIKELLENEYGYIYLCDDGDVFILFQGLARPILNKIGEQFKGMEEDLYTVFDLAQHWQLFFTLCKSKILTVPTTPAPVPRAPLPKMPLAEPDRELFQAACAKRSARKRLVVMVVEDDLFTQRLVNMTLKGEYDVVEAGSATEALMVYGGTAPDAVFLDIELPDASGHVVLSKLLAFDPAAYIVMLSGNSIKENILAALEKGAQGFVTKPFAKEKLLHYLHSCPAAQQHSPLRKGAPV